MNDCCNGRTLGRTHKKAVGVGVLENQKIRQMDRVSNRVASLLFTIFIIHIIMYFLNFFFGNGTPRNGSDLGSRSRAAVGFSAVLSANFII